MYVPAEGVVHSIGVLAALLFASPEAQVLFQRTVPCCSDMATPHAFCKLDGTA
jgi:hypothetical protein